ncbi:glutathione S-transferase [Caulobacter ginsengisoli]|uniref:Glutathione S-transferase n=1 Tax=Caulobacter ginsengisoli TaxID=400775 RepID=A0ABU0IWN3_9CAUL|nr:glutathione S-transferase family protein [Caulobacter ginsengisoli]MDQ0466414.1 glutathione S-transferase [Caulobacter ginsengisoli]
MTDYILYGHRESGHSYKARLALTLLGLPHDYREVEVFLPREERRADWRAVSKFGEIPVLVAGGKAIVQSNAILLHLARTHGALGWEVDPDRLTEWLFWEANRIGISLPNLRYALMWEPDTEPRVLGWLRQRMLADLARLEGEFAERPFLLGDAVSAADLSCCGYMFFADQAGVDLGDWPAVAAWLERIKALPGWKHPYELMM